MNEQIRQLESEIAQKNQRLEQLKQNHIQKLNSSKDFITALGQTFESSSQTTDQFKSFYRLFKKDFVKILARFNASQIEIDKGHFYINGFFTVNNQIFYFSIGDLRWNKSFLLRTAKHYKDWTGGTNHFISLSSREEFIKGLRYFLEAKYD